MIQEDWNQGFVVGIMSGISSKGVSEQFMLDSITDSLTSIGYVTPHGLSLLDLETRIKAITTFGLTYKLFQTIVYKLIIGLDTSLDIDINYPMPNNIVQNIPFVIQDQMTTTINITLK